MGCMKGDIELTDARYFRQDIDINELVDLNAEIRTTRDELQRLCALRTKDVCPYSKGQAIEWTVGDKRPRKRYAVIEFIEPDLKAPYYKLFVKMIKSDGTEGGQARMCRIDLIRPYSEDMEAINEYLKGLEK